MSPRELALIGIVPSVLGVLVAWFAYEARKSVQEIHVMINSRMTAWLDAATAAAHAKGVQSVLAEGLARELVAKAGLISTAQLAAAQLVSTAHIAATRLLADAKNVAGQSPPYDGRL